MRNDRKSLMIFAALLGLLALLMMGLTARADAAPPIGPDQTTYKAVPDQVVVPRGVPDQVKMPAAVPQKYTPIQSVPVPIGDLFGRQPCQPVRNVIRRLIREKIKDRLIPTPPSFPIGWPNGVMSSRIGVCTRAGCW